MNYRTLGKTNYKISDIGFGAWAIGGSSWGKQDDSDSIKALHAAIDAGVTFIDTAQGYGNGHSERLIGQVLKERSEDIIVATKTLHRRMAFGRLLPTIPGRIDTTKSIFGPMLKTGYETWV